METKLNQTTEEIQEELGDLQAQKKLEFLQQDLDMRLEVIVEQLNEALDLIPEGDLYQVKIKFRAMGDWLCDISEELEEELIKGGQPTAVACASLLDLLREMRQMMAKAKVKLSTSYSTEGMEETLRSLSGMALLGAAVASEGG